MRNKLGMALAVSLAMPGMAAAQDDAGWSWTGAYGGISLDSFGYDAEGNDGANAGELETNVLTFTGFGGYDHEVSDYFFVGGEAGFMLNSGSAEDDDGLKFKYASGYYARLRAGAILKFETKYFGIEEEQRGGHGIYGILGYGSYKGEFDRANDPAEFLLPDGSAIEYGFGVETRIVGKNARKPGRGFSTRVEFVFLNFSEPSGVEDYESSSAKISLGLAYRF